MSGSTKNYFKDILAMIVASNRFMRCIYNAALWLSDDERNDLLKNGVLVVGYFHKCAQRAFDSQITRWKYMPKFHLFGELLHSLEVEKRAKQPSMNLLAFSTQQDEDFVGKISVMSRNVSVKTVRSRTLGRYLVALASHW